MRTMGLKHAWIMLVLLALVGCAEKLTYQRWQTVHDGMSRDAVQATLGKPWQTTDQTWLYYDEDRHINAQIYYEGDKVIGKAWQDPEFGMKGKSPHVGQPGESEDLKAQTVN